MRKTILLVVAVFLCFDIASAQISPIERSALIALYNSTNGAGWTNSTNWLGAVGTECTWNGVGCSDGHVSSLYLPSNELSGNIPSEFGDLTSLVTVYLNSNHLSGIIPPQLGDLTSLRDLRLNSNDLSGSIPSELGSMAALTVLYLSGNQLTGSIPPELGDLSSVTALSLGSNQLTGSIPPELGDLTSLVNLYLNGNQLSGSIPPELGALPGLQDLRLSSNSLGGSIPPELGDLLGLTTLRLAGNQLGGGIPPELGSLSSLTSLLLDYNRLGGSIPTELGDLSSLRNLNLGHNRLSGGIPPELASLSALTKLYLDFNRLSGSIPPQLGILSALEYLRLGSNRLSGVVPTELQNLSSLSTGIGLDLRFNAVHSEDASLIAFLDSKQLSGDWQSTQTIAPENVSVEWVGDHTVWLSWDAVSFQGYSGGYEAFCSPAATGQWVSAGRTAPKTELNIPITGLDTGAVYDFSVASYTLPNNSNQNTVTSDLGEPVMSTTADTGCAAPVIDLVWGDPAILSLMSSYDSYEWSTGETSSTIEVDPNDPRFYWVTVTSSGPCRESAMVVVDPSFFADGFESGDLDPWSSAAP